LGDEDYVGKYVCLFIALAYSGLWLFEAGI